MDLGLNGARALVGGASRGIGAGIASVLVAEGAAVAVTARPSPRLQELAARIGARAVPADLSMEAGPSDAVAQTVAELGGLDLLVVNSGGPPGGAFGDLRAAQWQAAIDGTLLSTVRLLTAALPHLREGRDPAIIVILSSSVREPLPGLVTSNVLRPGLVGLIKSLAPEIAPIRINGIAPGRIATDRIAETDAARARSSGTSVEEVRRQTIVRIPAGRYGEPEEVGRVAAFLLSTAASYVNAQVVAVDGGMIRSLP